MTPPRCVVVGAGIGGLAAALSLHEVRAEVELFDAVLEMQPLGVGINLLPHAERELGALGLLEQLGAHAVAPTLLLYCTRRGQEIWREPRGRSCPFTEARCTTCCSVPCATVGAGHSTWAGGWRSSPNAAAGPRPCSRTASRSTPT